ncbi:MAG: hypothetical protein LBP55_04820 [Candidatus Adiutrix sp.]|jgi:hypothetical protein|nr:hypothetical protein [Candidatus Adiutrix sp.]
MNADTVIRDEGMKVLVDKLGMLEAERFVMLIQSDSFDYTKWRKNLFKDMSLEDLSNAAMDYRKANQKA